MPLRAFRFLPFFRHRPMGGPALNRIQPMDPREQEVMDELRRLRAEKASAEAGDQPAAGNHN